MFRSLFGFLVRARGRLAPGVAALLFDGLLGRLLL